MNIEIFRRYKMQFEVHIKENIVTYMNQKLIKRMSENSIDSDRKQKITKAFFRETIENFTASNSHKRTGQNFIVNILCKQ